MPRLPFGFALALLVANAPTAQAPSPAEEAGLLPLEMVQVLDFDPVDLAALAKEDAEREAAGQPWRFAVPRDVWLTPDVAGMWEVLPSGDLIWRLRVAPMPRVKIWLGGQNF